MDQGRRILGIGGIRPYAYQAVEDAAAAAEAVGGAAQSDVPALTQ